MFPKLAFPDLMLPITLSELKLPTAVIFACEGNETVVATTAFGTCPVMFAPTMPNNLDAFPEKVPVVTPLLLKNLNDDEPLKLPLSLN